MLKYGENNNAYFEEYRKRKENHILYENKTKMSPRGENN